MSTPIFGFGNEYRFLSNFYLCDVYFDGILYPSAECAFQSAKTLDISLRQEFTKMTPSNAKKGGKILPVREDWEQVKTEIMASIVFDKFYRNKDLRLKLSETNDRHLEETNDWNDKIWGVCDGVGENRLGRILMRVREFWK